MRVLYADGFPHWGHGGAQRSLLDLIEALPGEFESLFLGVSGGSLVEHVKNAGVETVATPSWTIARPGWQAPRRTVLNLIVGRRRIRRLLREHRPDIVHLNSEGAASTVGEACVELGIPFLVHVRDMDRNWFPGFDRDAMEQADAIVVASEVMRGFVVTAGVDPSIVRVIHNGIDPRPFRSASDSRRAVREELGVADGKLAVGIVGSIIPRKGHLDLIHAAASLEMRRSPVRIFVLGSDPRPGRPHGIKVERAAEGAGLGHVLRFLGWRPNPARYFAAFDLTVAPFRREAFGRVVVESFLTGTPVVGYRDGALPEIIRHERDGLLVEPGNPRALADAILKLAVPGTLEEMSRNAVQRGLEFTVEAHAERVISLYREVLR